MMLRALIFIFVFCSGIIAAFFLDPAYGVALYVLIYFVHPQKSYWSGDVPDLRYPLIISLVMAASYLIRYKNYSQNRIFDAPQTKWLILLGIIMILTWPIAVNPSEHTEWTVLYWKYFLLYIILIKTVDSPQKFEWLIGSFIMGQFYWGYLAKFLGRNSDGRVEGIGGSDGDDANMTAAVMVTAVPFLIHYLIRGKLWQRIIALPALAFILNALVLINSRGAFLGLVGSVVFYLFYMLKTDKVAGSRKAGIFAIVVFVVGLFMYLSDNVFWNRMSTIETAIEQSEGQVERTYYWYKTFDVLRDHPLGVGAGGFEYLSPQYIPKAYLSRGSNTRAVHSTYFQVLGEYGIHGFILFVCLIVSTFRYIAKTKRALVNRGAFEFYYLATSLEAALVAFLVASLFIDRLYAEVLYWLIAFIAAFGNCCRTGSGDTSAVKTI